MNQTTEINLTKNSSLPVETPNMKRKSTFQTFLMYYKDALDELKACNKVKIDGNEFSCTKLIKEFCGCNFEEVFKVLLIDNFEERNAFTCRETSGCCQRAFVKKNNRSFTMDCFYIEPVADNIKDKTNPFMKIERVNGGFCAERAIIKVMDGEGDPIGYVKEEPLETGEVCSIHNKGNVLLYTIKLAKQRVVKSAGQNCIYYFCCCGCCGLCCKGKKEYQPFNPREENNFIIFKHKNRVGEMRYPCEIEFESVEDPIDRFLIILSRIFMVYFLDKSDTFGEKAYDRVKDACKNYMKYCCCCCGCC